jgi:hypothetical protein
MSTAGTSQGPGGAGAPRPAKILVLGEDRHAAEAVRLGFERDGHPVHHARELAADAVDDSVGLIVASARTAETAQAVLRAVGTVRTQRDVPLLYVGNGVSRRDAAAAGADEVIGRPAFVRDVVTIGRLLAGQPAETRGHWVGQLAETVGVYYLVRALASLGRSGVLTLSRGLRRGEVRFYLGEVTSAQVGGLHGQAALHQLLLWTDGRFDFRREDVVRRRQIPMLPEELFADAERFLTSVREASGGLSPAMVFEPDPKQMQNQGKQVPTEVHGVLRMFDGNRTLADVIEDSPYRVFETMRVAQTAVQAGLLRRVAVERPRAKFRAVLALEEWLAGDSKDAALARAAELEDSGTTNAVVKQEMPAQASGKRRRGKGSGPRSAARPLPASSTAASSVTSGAVTAPIAAAGPIDWGALVPRGIAAEMQGLAQVVPSSQASGEISIPKDLDAAPATRKSTRERLESMTSELRDRIFPSESSTSVEVTERMDAVVPPRNAGDTMRVAAVVPIPPQVEPAILVTPAAATEVMTAVPEPPIEPSHDDEWAAAKARAEAAERAEAEEWARREQAARERAAVEAAEAQARASAEAEAAAAERARLEAEAAVQAAERARQEAEERARAAAVHLEIAERMRQQMAERLRLEAEREAAEERAREAERAERERIEREAAERDAAQRAAQADAARKEAESMMRGLAQASARKEKTEAELEYEREFAKLEAEERAKEEAARAKHEAEDRAAVAAARAAAEQAAVAAKAAEQKAAAEQQAAAAAAKAAAEQQAAADAKAAAEQKAAAEAKAVADAHAAAEARAAAEADAAAKAAAAQAIAEARAAGPEQTTAAGVIGGEVGARGPTQPPPELTGGPSILVEDLAAAHAAVSTVAAAQAAAPPTANAATPAAEATVAAVRRDAVHFSDDEEAFFDQGHSPTFGHAAEPTESFHDLDEGYKPTGFWDRLLGRDGKKKKRR